MNTYEEKEIKGFLDQLESTSEQISEPEIANSIKSFIKDRFERNPPSILLWELMAFEFIEYLDDNSGWDTYFEPVFVSPNEEGGMVEYPSIWGITPEILSYWGKKGKRIQKSHF